MTRTESQSGMIACPFHLTSEIPNLLGFQPRGSLLVVGFAGERLTDAIRTGLTAVTLTGMLDTLAALQRGGATEVTGIVFSNIMTPGLPTPDDSALIPLFNALSGATLRPRDMVIVSGGRWRSLRCNDPDCCFPNGRLLSTISAKPAGPRTD